MSDLSLKLLLLGEDKSASKALKGVSDEADKTGGHLSKVGSALGVGLLGAAGAGIAGLGFLIKTGIGETKDASAGQAQLAAGIKSTGNAAGVTVDGMEDLASSIQNYSGQTDDSIVASEQLLLTFTNIKNVGPDKIFDDATRAAADMAAKMGGDAASKAVLLGKALNDPVKGITALTRVGVAFTDGQKNTIKSMVATGNTVGAQKVILGELNKEFGGAAKAAGESLPGQLERMKRKFEDVSQTLVTAMIPIFTKVADIIMVDVIPAISRLVDWVIANWPKMQQAIVSAWNQYLKPVFNAWLVYAKFMVNAYSQIVQYVVAHWPQIQAAMVTAWQNIKPTLMAFWGMVQTLWLQVLAPMVAWFVAHWPQIQTVGKAVLIGWAIALKVALVALRLVFDTIAILLRVFATSWRVTFAVAGAVVRATIATIKGIIDGATGIFNGLRAAVNAAVNFVTARFLDLIGFFTGLGLTISSIASSLWSPIGEQLSSIWNNVIKPILDAIQGGINTISSGLSGISGAAGKVGGLLGHIPGFATGGQLDLGGWNVVGEHGPELVGPGGRVHSNSASRSMLSRGGGSGVTEVHLHIDAPVFGVDNLVKTVAAGMEKASQMQGRTYQFKTA